MPSLTYFSIHTGSTRTFSQLFAKKTGDMPNNAVEMLWSIIVLLIQVYLSALILGTLLNYLVTLLCVYRASIFVFPHTTHTFSAILHNNLCFPLYHCRSSMIQMKKLTRGELKVCDSTCLPKASHPNYMRELCVTTNFNTPRIVIMPCHRVRIF
jgi:hypothetical protein